MSEVKGPMPVWIPGTDRRSFEDTMGLATIAEEGEINIKLYSAEHAKALVDAWKDGILLGISFDFQGPAEPKEG